MAEAIMWPLGRAMTERWWLSMPGRIKHTDMISRTCSKSIIKESELGGSTAPSP